jgi:hypothetical protein
MTVCLVSAAPVIQQETAHTAAAAAAALLSSGSSSESLLTSCNALHTVLAIGRSATAHYCGCALTLLPLAASSSTAA